MFPFQLPDFGKRKSERDDAYEEFRHMFGKSSFDEFTPSHNLRTLIHSSQQRRSIDGGDRRKHEKQKNKLNKRAGRGDSVRPSTIEEEWLRERVWSINDEDGWLTSPPYQELRASVDSTQSDDSGIENGENNDNALSQQQQQQQQQQRETHLNRYSTVEEQIQQKNNELQQNDLTPLSTKEIDIPILSPRTPESEQPFANPMERLRKRTELEIKESFAMSPPASTSGISTSPSMCFYGFPHRRSVVIDGRRCGENKWRRSYAEPRVHVSEPLWVPTFQNRDDVMSQFAPYDERLNNDGSEDWKVWEVLRGGYPSGWIGSALVTRQKHKKKRGEMERWKNFIQAH